MDLKLRGFDSEPLTLVVGAEALELYVPRSVLLQIRYFQAELLENIPADYRLKLTNTEPDIAAEVFYLAWTNHVAEIETPGEDEGLQSFADVVTKRTKAYVTARFWGLQCLTNAIMRSLEIYHRDRLVNPKDVMFLHDAVLEDSLLYRFYTERLGWDFKYCRIEIFRKRFPDFESTFKAIPHSILWELLSSPITVPDCEQCDHCQSCENLMTAGQPAKQEHWLTDEEGQTKEAT